MPTDSARILSYASTQTGTRSKGRCNLGGKPLTEMKFVAAQRYTYLPPALRSTSGHSQQYGGSDKRKQTRNFYCGPMLGVHTDET